MPKKTFLGLAKGLSGTAITKTRLAPKGGMSQILDLSIELKYAIKKHT